MIKTEHRKKKQKKTAIPEKKNIVPRIRASWIDLTTGRLAEEIVPWAWKWWREAVRLELKGVGLKHVQSYGGP